ncbi:hypothetical protein D9757_013023 [Collybiopsis confluens]|uniref:Uncharacterized protein n=1 Tax=Collybiopsis confluens TaxID=2823264 RepID=A0A8H5G5A5_9AGAR|nr:hypothetical protein D9757_013023 [Collybiopsis confluens]
MDFTLQFDGARSFYDSRPEDGVSAALDGGTEVMVFVYSFAVGGAGGRVVDFPRALNPVGNPDYCKRLT